MLLTMIIWKIQGILGAFVANKSSSQLLDILPKTIIFSKSFELKFSYIEVLLTDQNSEPLEMKDKINIILVIN